MASVLGKVLLWIALLGGLAGAVIAVYSLHVNGAVASLIVASVAGLVLLRLRPESREGTDADIALT
ncbi:hypothetical protein [Rhodococcus sp. CH91]|uniref:hypothetical protein n=1 Tax=Rhodococcus sp. CH91 TaxID=2910256 RepID=UPI001F4B18D1|nr:hypothetical protein [Rhodococcus sp. CH91]